MKKFFLLLILTTAARADLILQEDAGLPITAFNLTFRVGSADDPRGHEGLAYLTTRLLREGGVNQWKDMPARSRAELEDFLFPLAADIGVSIQKEQVALQVSTTAADAPTAMKVLSQVLLAPRFDPAELARLKSETLDALEKALPREDEEELGKAALDQAIWGKAHPYGHVVRGTVEGVKSVTVEMVKDFYVKHFVRKRLTFGIAGVVPKTLAAEAAALEKALPKGKSDRATIPPAPVSKGRDLTIVQGPFDATGVHIGIAVPFTRGSKDFASMYLSAIAFGKHRSFVGRLMRVVREVRGLNYGSYAYVEDFPNGGSLTTEPTQVARTRQAFTVWGRPTPPENGCFLARQLAREVHDLSTEGLTVDEFALGQSHLLGNIPVLGAALERSLGYRIDARFYGMKGDYLAQLAKGVEKAKRDGVNALLKKYLKSSDLHFVIVTKDPERLKKELLSEKCEIHYAAGIEKAKEVLDEDKVIATYPLGIKPDRIKVVTAESIYQN